MKLLYKIIICYLSFSLFTVSAFANCNFNTPPMVILGADCGASLQTGSPLSADPFYSDFVVMVESGECSGVVYANVGMPECAAALIIEADPTETYFISEYLGGSSGSDWSDESDWSVGGSSGVIDVGTLDTLTFNAEEETITVSVLPGNNSSSIPWFWVVPDSQMDILDILVSNLPPKVCRPNELSNSEPFIEIF